LTPPPILVVLSRRKMDNKAWFLHKPGCYTNRWWRCAPWGICV